MTTLAFGNLLRMDGKTEIEEEGGGYVVAQHRFQNFFIGKEIVYGGENYMFLPFGFSGVTINRNADGMEANLVFPNQRSGSFEAGQTPAGRDLTTNWADEAIKQQQNQQLQTMYQAGRTLHVATESSGVEISNLRNELNQAGGNTDAVRQEIESYKLQILSMQRAEAERQVLDIESRLALSQQFTTPKRDEERPNIHQSAQRDEGQPTIHQCAPTGFTQGGEQSQHAARGDLWQ